MSEANRVIEVNATGINKINGKTLQEISSELAQANNNNAEESSFEVEANVFNSEGSPEGGSADDNKLYITINDQSASDGIYTPLNGSFIHVLGETFEVGSEDPVNDQLQGLRDALKTGINNLFGSAYGEWVDPMVFEDGRWDHDDHEENDGKLYRDLYPMSPKATAHRSPKTTTLVKAPKAILTPLKNVFGKWNPRRRLRSYFTITNESTSIEEPSSNLVNALENLYVKGTVGVFEDAKWNHEEHTEVQGENVVYIHFNKAALTDEQVMLYVTEGNSETGNDVPSDDSSDNENESDTFIQS